MSTPPGDYGPEIHLPPAYDARCTSCGRTRGECRRIVYYLDHITRARQGTGGTALHEGRGCGGAG